MRAKHFKLLAKFIWCCMRNKEQASFSERFWLSHLVFFRVSPFDLRYQKFDGLFLFSLIAIYLAASSWVDWSVWFWNSGEFLVVFYDLIFLFCSFLWTLLCLNQTIAVIQAGHGLLQLGSCKTVSSLSVLSPLLFGCCFWTVDRRVYTRTCVWEC